MSSYTPSSSRLGSIRISRTSSGVRLVEDARDHALRPTLLPVPVDAGDEEVGHGREVGDEGLAVDGLAEARVSFEGTCGRRPPRGSRAGRSVSRDLVRDLDADGATCR